MRQLFPLLMALVVPLSAAAGQPSTLSNRTHNAALSLIDVPFPSKVNASIAPESTATDDASLDGSDSDNQNKEARGVMNCLPLFSDTLNAVRTKYLLWREKRPLEVLGHFGIREKLNRPINYERRMRWIDYAHAFFTQYGSFGDDSGRRHVRKLVKEQRMYYHELRKDSRMKEYADSMQHTLAVKFGDGFLDMRQVWLKDQVNPGEVYRMMSVAADQKLTGSLTEWEM
uniref:Uncharacterized protein n=1 Tax=Peronospora matthiolae TaxID=2874970 RepID=A0AAV1UEE6_9STRA